LTGGKIVQTSDDFRDAVVPRIDEEKTKPARNIVTQTVRQGRNGAIGHIMAQLKLQIRLQIVGQAGFIGEQCQTAQ
jgi:hypothetical protein